MMTCAPAEAQLERQHTAATVSARIITAICSAACLLACSATAAAQPPSGAQGRYLASAERGVAIAQRDWGDRRLHWYDARLHDTARYPLATIWDAAPLFQSLDAIAIASPTRGHLAAVRAFAAGAERYLNRGLRPVPGYSPYPGDRSPDTQTWFDDNGWWGLGFVNAYRATHDRRYLADAQRALTYIARAGWDPGGGGIWWNTSHPYKAGEALASGTLLATLLYSYTHSAYDLAQAQRFLGWANGPGFSAADGLYARSDSDHTPEDYIEAPLIYAQELLCRLQGIQQYCTRAQTLVSVSLRRFGDGTLDFAPQYDAIYLQWLLALYALDGDARLYDLAAANASAAQSNALDPAGLFMRSWQGAPLAAPAVSAPGMLQTQSATTSVFAWLAVYAPPGA